MSHTLGRILFGAVIIAGVLTGFYPPLCAGFHVQQSTSRTNRCSTVPTVQNESNRYLVAGRCRSQKRRLKMGSSDETTKKENVDLLAASAKIGTITNDEPQKGTIGSDAELEMSSDEDEETSLIVKVLFGLFLVLGEFYLIVALQ